MIETLSTLDHDLFLVMNSWHATWLNPIMVFFSSQIVWVPLIALLVFIAFKELDKKSFALFLLFMILTIIASDVTSSYVLKNVVQRLRPCRLPEIKAIYNDFGQKCGGRFGFVSSHAANSICILVFSLLALKIKSMKFHLLWLLPLIVCFSRIYLGVHYPGDILGGLLVGSFWGAALGWSFVSRRSWGQTA